MNNKNLILLFLIFSIGCSSSGKIGSYNVIFIGDSITEGVGVECPNIESSSVVAGNLLKESGCVHYVNCGKNGATTTDFLPEKKNHYFSVLKAADTLYTSNIPLIFSMMIGTNDSAESGPTGAPVSPEKYEENLTVIIDSLHERYPYSFFILHCPIWYSPNTHNGSVYMEKGLERLQSYIPVLERIVKSKENVYMGDQDAYLFFEQNYKQYINPENGKMGVFYLHPNKYGAKKLGEFWAKSIKKNLLKIGIEQKTI